MQPLPPFAERFLLLRKRLGMNQTELSRKLGCSQAMVSAYETGKAVCSVAELEVLCKLTGASADWVIGLSDFEHGLAPDQWIVDEEAVDVMRRNPKGARIPALFKVPRRAKIVDLSDAQKLVKELKLERLN